MKYTNLKIEMVKKHMSAVELARIVGMSKQQLYSKMIGRSPMRLSECIAIKKALDTDLSIEDLFNED